MKALYWLNVLGNVGTALTALSIMGCVLFLIITVIWYCDYNADGEDRALVGFKKTLKWTIVSVICLIGSMFIPNEQQLYVIYGVGSTIDYLKDSDEAKKLPDNVIKACNVYLEDYTDVKMTENNDSTANK